MLILCDINPRMTKAWQKDFKGINVDIVNYDFRELATIYPDELLVLCSAGNSYGIMGGGLDLAIAKYIPGIEEHVRSGIELGFNGELFVGCSLVTSLVKEYLPFSHLVYSPTMRFPQQLITSENVYKATRAALNALERIKVQKNSALSFRTDLMSLVLPGFGGSCGGLDPEHISRTMRVAYQRHMSKYQPQTHSQMIEENAYLQRVFVNG